MRKRSEREQLNCYDCPQCRKFYEALRNTGHDDEDVRTMFPQGSTCSNAGGDHSTTASTTSCHGPVTTITTRTSHLGFGRHRARFAPSSTPTDFWELDFIDER